MNHFCCPTATTKALLFYHLSFIIFHLAKRYCLVERKDYLNYKKIKVSCIISARNFPLSFIIFYLARLGVLRFALVSIHSDMEAALMHFVFHKASLLLAHIIKHLRKNPLQGVVSYHSAVFTWSLNCFVAIITDIEGGTIEMT